MNNLGFLKLLQSLDALFPIGTFTMSNGLETYVQKNLIYDEKTLTDFLNGYIYMLSYNDLAFCVKAYQNEDIHLLDEIFTASKSPYELRNGSIKLCTRFLKTENTLGDYPSLKFYAESIEKGENMGSYPIAMGLFIKDLNMDIIQGLEMYCYSIISSMVNHAVKLVPLRQLDGQISLSKVSEKISQAVDVALKVSIEDLGISGSGFDLRSMQHETLYSRLYIS